MDYPHGRHPDHHRHPHRGGDRREQQEEEQNYDYPPPPFYGGDGPPPPQVFHTPHMGPGPDSYHHPPPTFYGGDEPPPPHFYGGDGPPPPQVYHTSHIPGPDSYRPPPPPAAVDHHHRPHIPHPPPHHKEEEQGGNNYNNRPTVRMYSKAEINYSLTIRDGKVILARSDPSDPFQHWIRDERLSTRVKDEEGFPSFALVNKATGQAMKHSIGATHPVQLIPYNSNGFDESVLWTESKDLGDGYRAIRMVNNIKLNVDAFNGDKNHGGVHDGTTIVLWEWKKGDNQRWKIVPYCKSLRTILKYKIPIRYYREDTWRNKAVVDLSAVVFDVSYFFMEEGGSCFFQCPLFLM